MIQTNPDAVFQGTAARLIKDTRSAGLSKAVQ
jgi:hypothetical protein